ncbi:MAG: hypothetical protein KGJ07_00060 [Patescibacteria group bacterium]|nr:hypothetical protein [Patescibacteria group bacterium]
MLSAGFSPYSPILTTGEQLRQPRALVVINGFNVLWHDITITTTTFYVADSFHLEIPLYGQPNGFNFQYLSTLAQLNISIYVGFPQDPNSFNTEDLELLMVSDCDEMTIDPLKAIVTFTGRDLTSRFIDTKTYSYYPNLTASAIAIMLAEQQGLGTSLITATQGNVGTFFTGADTNQTTLLSKETTQWDLLTFLAQQYNYAVYVQPYQNTSGASANLVFAPRPTPENSEPYILRYQPPPSAGASPISNTMDLNFTRAFTLSKDVTVKIRVPYSPLTGRAFTSVAGKKNPTINSSNAGNQIYTFTYPGLTKAQALAKAQSLLSNITINEIKLSAYLPGDNVLKKSSIIKVIGTNTRFDQIYYTDTVVRTINFTDGYTMEVRAKNQDVNSQVVL